MKNVKRIDISQTLEKGMLRYGSIEDFSFQWLRQHEKGDGLAQSRFEMNSHLGTHIDAPLHFVEGGRTVDAIPLDTLCGPAQVLDGRGRAYINLDFLKEIDIHSPRLLFLTDNSRKLQSMGPDFDYVYFSPEACRYMVEQGVLLLGTDYFNVDRRGDKSRAAHRPLLNAGVVILEGLQLAEVSPGDYTLYCLPLKMGGLEGAPCRAILEVTEN